MRTFQHSHIMTSNLPLWRFVCLFDFREEDIPRGDVDVFGFFVLVVEDPAVEPEGSVVEVEMKELSEEERFSWSSAISCLCSSLSSFLLSSLCSDLGLVSCSWEDWEIGGW